MNYILSLKHSPKEGAAVWFRPESKGYTTDLSQAGVYSDAMVSRNPLCYNNGTTNKAIPVDEARRLSQVNVPYTDVRGYTSNRFKKVAKA
jgi:hypothetical protein